MRCSLSTYHPHKVCSVLGMLMLLLWLSVSTPFVYAAQQSCLTENSAEESAVPFAGVEEEKSSTTMIQEYITEEKLVHHLFAIPVLFEKCHQCDEYLAYHPDPHCPPPNAAA